MIQRKQSLFLLIVALNAVVIFLMPFQELCSDVMHVPITIIPWQVNFQQSTYIYVPFLINLLALIISIFTIFKFKNRVMQYKLANLIILLNVFLIGSYFLYPSSEIPANHYIKYKVAAFYPIFGAIFAYLAAHFIKKDEQLVRSADRIR
jgi:hypothetical protein